MFYSAILQNVSEKFILIVFFILIIYLGKETFSVALEHVKWSRKRKY